MKCGSVACAAMFSIAAHVSVSFAVLCAAILWPSTVDICMSLAALPVLSTALVFLVVTATPKMAYEDTSPPVGRRDAPSENP